MSRITRLLFLPVLCAFLMSPAFAQVKVKKYTPPDSLEEYFDSQYKKQNRDQITLIATDRAGEAVDYFEKYRAEIPDDLETLYGLTLAYTQLGEFEKAMAVLEESVEKGLPFGRYVAGPRNLLAPLYQQPAYQDYARQQAVRLVHGPVVGSVTDARARFWVRTADESDVRITLSTNADLSGATRSAAARSKAASDYTAVAEADGLQPDTRYFYAVSIDGTPVPLDPAPSFRTFPKPGSAAHFTVAFGGGAGFTPWHEHMWTTLRHADLLAMLELGDNVYIDTPEVRETQRYCYYRRQSRAEYRAFAASTPLFAVWDDHDFGDNDCCNGPLFEEPAWKKDVLEVFKQNFVNPSYGSDGTPGIWFTAGIGDVDFFFLDTRMYRDYPDTKPRSMLGPIQKQWLFDQLRASDATFKVIASSLPYAEGAKPGSTDPWEGFPDEREELLSFIQDQDINGVVLISADRHRSDAWRIARPRGYDLYEFMSSKLTNFATHKLMDGALFGYNDKCSYGRLEFDTTLADPQVTYTIVNIDGIPIESLTVKRSQLTNN